MDENIWTPENSDPHEVWAEIKDFPGYSISDQGRVRNDSSGHILKMSQNQYEVLRVGMMQEGKQQTRSVALLVAQHHLGPPADNSVFDTPINLDGDRLNNRVENLMWRPRWFALQYARQFKPGARLGFKVPIQAIFTGDIFPDSLAAAIRFGILAEDTVKSAIHNQFVFPTFQKFKVLGEHADDVENKIEVPV